MKRNAINDRMQPLIRLGSVISSLRWKSYATGDDEITLFNHNKCLNPNDSQASILCDTKLPTSASNSVTIYAVWTKEPRRYRTEYRQTQACSPCSYRLGLGKGWTLGIRPLQLSHRRVSIANITTSSLCSINCGCIQVLTSWNWLYKALFSTYCIYIQLCLKVRRASAFCEELRSHLKAKAV